MRFYDREKEIDILRQNKLQAEQSAMFTVLKRQRHDTLQRLCRRRSIEVSNK